ncbi:MAG: hypothetical protein O3B76_11505 [Proteobacteria bacterium]|nr:hypothetical protein [Pseudomonadota bacterium]MDA1024134.1 hypothetical protein [Pseudomonadota bacterium]
MFEDNNEKDNNEPRWRRVLRIGAFAIGLIAVAAGPVFHYFQTDPHVGWALMITGLIFMVASRFDDVIEIGFGSFQTKLERRITKVEDAMAAVRRLAKASARNALNSVQFAGRMGGFSEPEKMLFLRDTRRLLRDLGIDDDEVSETEIDWNKAVEFDYAFWALGLNQLPDDITEDLKPRWDDLRKGGVVGRATSKEILAFFKKADILTPDRAQILEDYEHYEKTRQHRREDEWLRRRERK